MLSPLAVALAVQLNEKSGFFLPEAEPCWQNARFFL